MIVPADALLTIARSAPRNWTLDGGGGSRPIVVTLPAPFVYVPGAEERTSTLAVHDA